LKLYYSKSISERQNLNSEMAELLGFMMYVSALGVDLTDELLPTIPKDDQYQVRMDGLRQMYSGLTTVFAGAEHTLTENNGFSSRDRSVVLIAMAATLPRVKKIFAKDFRAELRTKLEADKAKFPEPADAARIEEMVRELGV